MFNFKPSQLAQPGILPDIDRPYGLPVFNSIADMLDSYTGDDAAYILYPQRVAARAEQFLAGFPGTSLYAVKANPHPAMLKILWSAGIRHFDVASVREIDLIQALSTDARLYLMHPVKSRKTIAYAYQSGVRDMAFDCLSELEKITAETGRARDLNLHLRLAVPNGAAIMPLAGKFGADWDHAIECLVAARPLVKKLGISFHVGSQCLDPEAYRSTIKYVRALLDTAGIEIDTLDCGGGFPIQYPGMDVAGLETYFTTIQAALAEYGFSELEIFGEPGRALCAEGGSTLARVELRKGNDLYLNEGSFGSLFDAGRFAWKHETRRHRPVHASQQTWTPRTQDQQAGFRFFGPTCDSSDVMAGPFYLPDDIREGDWIEICNLGAYGQALATDFNGFQSETTVAILEDNSSCNPPLASSPATSRI